MGARRLSTSRLDLVTATPQHVLVELDDSSKLGPLLAAELPESWPPEHHGEAALRYTLDRLHEGPDQIGWWMRYVVRKASADTKRTVVGIVGAKGPPTDGIVEVGYSLASEFQGQGLASEAVSALVDWAFEQEGVQRVVAHCLEGSKSQQLLEKLDFVSEGAGPEPGTIRFGKTKERWIEEGPPSRRSPPLRPQPDGTPIEGLPPMAKDVFARLMEEPLRDVQTLLSEVDDYVAMLERTGALNPEVDVDIGREVGRVCRGLLEAVNERTPESARRQVQAAARYFVTEDDGDSDLVIGGLDEDAAVANAVARHLGRADLVSEVV